MSLSSTPLWSEEQREWLQALGHDLLELASAAPASTPMTAVDGPAHVQAARGNGERGTENVVAHPVATLPDTPLLRALARAAGRPPQDPELLAVLPDLSLLRGNPGARRALWPQLRALRPGRNR